MSKIKTRETVKDIKVLDKAAVAGERMKDAFIRTKDTVQNLSDDGQVSPTEYAEDKIQYAAQDVAEDTGRAVSSGTKKAVNKGKEAYRQHREIKKATKAADKPPSAARQTASQASRSARGQTNRTVRSTQQAGKQTVTPMEPTIERWYSMKEICEYLGVSRDTVLAWIEKRNMPAAKIGRL